MPDEQTDQQHVERDLRRARVAWNSRVGRRDRLWNYLQTVFEIGQRWKKEEKGIQYQLLMLKLANVHLDGKLLGRFRVLLYCTSDPKSPSDFKVRNKWVQWLELASEKIKEGQTLREFVKERGGSVSDAPLR